MEIDHRRMFYSRISSFTILTLLTSLQQNLVTSTLKHIGGDQYTKARVQPASPTRLIAERTLLKVSKAKKSDVIWLRCQKASAVNSKKHW